MKVLEVYYDYLCPYCYRGHLMLQKLLQHHDVTVVWKPCEANPRPEVASIHSDVAIAGAFFLRDHGGDLERYNDLVYAAHYEQHKRIDDIALLRELAVSCGADGEAFAAALEGGEYTEEVLAANREAWGEKGWAAIPSYASGSKTIGSTLGVLVSETALDAFIAAL